MQTAAGLLLRVLGVGAVAYAEIVTLIWVYNEHGLGWAVAALILLPSTLVLSFIANVWYGVILWAGLLAVMYGRYLSKGYWESDEDHARRVEREMWESRVQEQLRDETGPPMDGRAGPQTQDDPRVRRLQELYANRVSFGASLVSEMREIDEVYGQLRDLGADADPVLVEREKRRNASWMQENPGYGFYEPHLDVQRFDEERLAKKQPRQPSSGWDEDSRPAITLDITGTYSAAQLYHALQDSIRELNLRRPQEVDFGDWYQALVEAGDSGYESILLKPGGKEETIALDLSTQLPSHTVGTLSEEVETWVSFEADQGA